MSSTNLILLVAGFVGLAVIVLFGLLVKNKRQEPETHHEPPGSPKHAGDGTHGSPKPATGHDDHSGGHSDHGHTKPIGQRLINLVFVALTIAVVAVVFFWIWSAGGRSVYLEATSQKTHVAHPYQPMNKTRAPETAVSSTLPSSAVLQKVIDVPPHSEGFSESFGFPPDGVMRTICRSRSPDADGFDVQYRDSRYDDEDDAHFYDQIPEGNANAERYRSTDEVGFKMRVWLVNAGQDCSSYRWAE